MTLYEILEVPKNATDEQIKKSYRKKAAKNHPDQNPGDSEANEIYIRVTLAYEVLSDPERRKYYDETGSTKENNNQEAIAGLLVKAFIDSLMRIESPDKIDMKQMTLNMVKQQRQEIVNKIEMLQRGTDALKKTKGRFKTNNKDKINFFEEFITINIRKNEEEIIKVKKEKLDLHNKAIEYLEDMTYDFEKEMSRNYINSEVWIHPPQAQIPAHDPEDSDLEDDSDLLEDGSETE